MKPRRPFFMPLLSALIAFAAALAPSQARADLSARTLTVPSGVQITPMEVFEDIICYRGNAPVRFNIKNPTRLAQFVSIELPLAASRGNSSPSTSLAAFVELPPESERTLNVPIPFAPYCAQNYRIREMPWVVRDSSGAVTRFEGSRALMDFLPDYRITERDIDSKPRPRCNFTVAIAKSYANGNSETNKEYNVEALSKHPRIDHGGLFHRIDLSRPMRWQDLSCFDAIVLTSAEYEAAPDTFKEILPAYIAAGGSLVWVGERDYFGPFGLGEIIKWDGQDAKAIVPAIERAAARLQAALDDPGVARLISSTRADTPFLLIILVLAAFAVLAGPLTIYILSRCNRHIAILWVFPIIAVIFSIGVAAVIICRHGIAPRIHQFAHILVDERAGLVATVQNDVIISPLPLLAPIVYDANDSIVEYFSSDRYGDTGDTIVFADGKFEYHGGWAPPLWPVTFRSISVRKLEDWNESAEQVSLPYNGRIKARTVDSHIERRSAK